MKKMMHFTTFTWIIISCLMGVRISQAQTDQKQERDAIKIEIKDIALPSVDTRYTTVKKIPKGTYVPWSMDRGSMFGEKTIEFVQPNNMIFVEVLILLKNHGPNEEKVVIDDVRLDFAKDRIEPWEYLPAEAYDYDSLAKRISMSSDKIILKIFGGTIYCILKPAEQTWLVLIFQVPKNVEKANLYFGKTKPLAIKIPGSSK